MGKYRKPYRAKKKKIYFKESVFLAGCFGFEFCGRFFLFFFLSPIFRIKEITISGNQKVKTETIKETIRAKNIFLAHLEVAKKEILEKFPQIAKISLKRKFPDKIIVRIEERKPVAIFSQGDNLFSLDKEGVIFAPIRNDISNGVGESSLLKIQKIDEAGPRPDLRLGERVLEEGLVSSILEIKFKLEDLKIPLNEVLAVSGERLNVKTSEGWEIYFDPTKDLNWQTTKLKAVLEQEISIDRRKSLQYIELRFGNLASYK